MELIGLHPLLSALGWMLSLLPNFQKWGLDRASIFRGELLGKKEVTFFREGCNLYIKNEL